MITSSAVTSCLHLLPSLLMKFIFCSKGNTFPTHSSLLNEVVTLSNIISSLLSSLVFFDYLSCFVYRITNKATIIRSFKFLTATYSVCTISVSDYFFVVFYNNLYVETSGLSTFKGFYFFDDVLFLDKI